MINDNINPNILITGIHGFADNGEVALLLGAITNLKIEFPKAHFYYGSIDSSDEIRIKDIFPDMHQDITLIKPGFFANKRFPWLLRTILLFLSYIPYYIKSDIGIHIGADGYGDVTIGGALSTIAHSYQLLLGRFFNKKVVACAQTIGPFKYFFTRQIAKFTLNQVNLITVREKFTQERLLKIGLKKPLYIVSDLAYLLEATNKERVNYILKQQGITRNKPLACIAPSEIVPSKIQTPESLSKKTILYIQTMADIADILATKNLDVIITCQTTGERQSEYLLAQKIRERAKYKPWIMPICLTPQELKGIMGVCEIVVSSKMHSALFSTSMSVPTVVLGYHSKLYGILGIIPVQTDFIVDVKAESFFKFQNNLMKKIEDCWYSREKIKIELEKGALEPRKSALISIELIGKLMTGFNQC